MLRLVPLALLALPSLAWADPDFEVVSVQGRCHPVSRLPSVVIEVVNTGDVPETPFIDVFTDLSGPPALGDIGANWFPTWGLQPWVYSTYEKELVGVSHGHSVRVDVLINSLEDGGETDFSDNWGVTWADFWDCK